MIRIGTSGWVYEDWKGRFYPEDVDAYVYFNNDWEAHAVDNARQLRALIEGFQPS
ncbi:MAG: hypothetical protein ACP5HG_05410 [Anaerolineae bacterium]